MAAVVTAAWSQRSTVSEIIDLAVVWLVCGLKKPEDLTLILREQVPKNNCHLEKWMQQRAQLGAQISLPPRVMVAQEELGQVNPNGRYQRPSV